MIAYLDSSVFLRKILGEPEPLDFSGFESIISSTLLQVECFRTLDRFRIVRRASPDNYAQRLGFLRQLLQSYLLIHPDSQVFEKASQTYPTVVRTLDAIHLATALLWKEENSQDLVFLTHDAELKVAAQAMGLDVQG